MALALLVNRMEHRVDDATRPAAPTAVQHRDALYRTALRLTACPKDADDLIQETYRRAQRLLSAHRPGMNLKVWLILLLHDTYIDQLRTVSRALGIPLSRLCGGRRAMRRLLAQPGLRKAGFPDSSSVSDAELW